MMISSAYKTVLLGVAVACMPVPPVNARREVKDTLFTMSCLAAGYGASVVYHLYVYRQALSRYQAPLALAAVYAYQDPVYFYKELWSLINIDNFYWAKKTSPYYNYPVVEFVNQIDISINALSRGSWLTVPLQLSSDMHRLLLQLADLRLYCVRHEDYIKQRRQAAVQMQQQGHVHKK